MTIPCEDYYEPMDLIDLVDGANNAHLAVENRDLIALSDETPESIIVQDRDGETPLHYAATNGDLNICKMLVNMNPLVVHIKDIENKTAYDWAVAYNIEYNGSHQDVCDFLKNYM